MDTMMKVREILCTELDELATKPKLTADSLAEIDKITHSIKSIDTILAMQGSGYSGRMYPHGEDMTYQYGYNNSYRYQPRDSMGRYTSYGWDAMPYSGANNPAQNNGVYNTGYYGTGDMHSKLSEMMNKATDPKEREIIQRIMNTM